MKRQQKPLSHQNASKKNIFSKNKSLAKLQMIQGLSTFFEKQKTTKREKSDKISIVEQYFQAWNKRDMEAAVACFTEDCTYDDTQYNTPFQGKKALTKHLLRVANALPNSFQFVIDDIAVAETKIGVQWHVENNNEPLPFTRGCSFYTIDSETNLIQSGFDVPEPAVFKPGDTGLNLLSTASNFISEPIRVIPFLSWIAYCYIVFFSNGILPGADATQLEQRTWEEVLNLSLNFFLVAPLLKLPFSPTVHPMLECIFNFLLSWAALFVAFLSDDREDKPSVLPMFPIVIGMQFLTSAFFLPYLAFRSSEPKEKSKHNSTPSIVYQEQLSSIQLNVSEKRILGPILGGVGILSIIWAFIGRTEEYGSTFAERYSSLIDILSIDRVGSSFIVDLVIFGIFQGWLVDDDLSRRGIQETDQLTLRNVAKFVPFFGLVYYICFRPSFPSLEQSIAEK